MNVGAITSKLTSRALSRFSAAAARAAAPVANQADNENGSNRTSLRPMLLQLRYQARKAAHRRFVLDQRKKRPTAHKLGRPQRRKYQVQIGEKTYNLNAEQYKQITREMRDAVAAGQPLTRPPLWLAVLQYKRASVKFERLAKKKARMSKKAGQQVVASLEKDLRKVKFERVASLVESQNAQTEGERLVNRTIHQAKTAVANA